MSRLPDPIFEPLPLSPGERGSELAPVDAAWLRMDDRENLMHVHGALVVAGDLTWDEAALVLGGRLAKIPRFAQRVARDGDRLFWVDDRDFALERHVVAERLPEPGGEPELATAIAAHFEAPFDRRFPLWEFRLLHGYRGEDTVVLARIHHSIGDGVALMVVLLAMTDLLGRGSMTAPPASSTAAPDANPFLELLCSGPGAAVDAARSAAERWMPDTLRLMLAPVEAYGRIAGWQKAAGSTLAMLRLLGRPSEPSSLFRGDLGIQKRVAWTEPLALDEVKRVGRRLGGTVNELLNTAMAGALRRYLARTAAPPESLAFRCAMPVNLRPLDEMAALGNRFGLIFLELPVGISDPRYRLEALRRSSESLKRSLEPLVVLQILRWMGQMPEPTRRLAVKLFGTKVTAVFTNVPGPSTTLGFGGKPIRDIFVWVPQAGRVGLGVSIFSYDGRVRMGVATDAGLVPDPERIVEGFYAEWDAFLRLAG